MAQTITQALAWARGILSSEGIDTATVDASVLLAYCLKLSREDLIVHRDRHLTEHERQTFVSLIARRALREPVAYLTGEKEFFGRRFLVNEHVLIPRPETEILVEQALALAPKGAVIFEIGVGSGAVVVSILAERDDLKGMGNDISIHALRTARVNASLLGVSGRLRLYAGHVLAGLKCRVPVLVANPPYIPDRDVRILEDDVRIYEPHEALFGGKDGLDIVKEIIARAPSHLSPGGILLMEVGIGQQEAVGSLASLNKDITIKAWKKDLGGIPRVVIMESVHG